MIPSTTVKRECKLPTPLVVRESYLVFPAGATEFSTDRLVALVCNIRRGRKSSPIPTQRDCLLITELLLA